MKRCAKCGETKPLEDFTPNRRVKDGRQGRCRPCRREDQAAYYAKNRDEILRRNPSQPSRDPEKRRQRDRERYAALTPEQRARIREVRKAWYAANAEERRAYQRAYMASNPEARATNRRLVAEWYKRNPARTRDKHARRRAREGAGRVTQEEWDALLVREGGYCAYCGTESEKLTMDHVVPLSRGGAHSIENILPACKSCNSRKSARTPSEWFGLVN